MKRIPLFPPMDQFRPVTRWCLRTFLLVGAGGGILILSAVIAVVWLVVAYYLGWMP